MNTQAKKQVRVDTDRAISHTSPRPPTEPPAPIKRKPFTGTYEFELEGRRYPFTKRRALALKAYIDTDGEADPQIVAADMDKEFGPPKRGTSLAKARRIRGIYKRLKAAGVL